MGKLITADDGLPAEAEVGEWAKDKHRALQAYLRFHANARIDFKHRAYIDLFCGPGRAQLKDGGQFIDGSAIVAWKTSLEKAPFTQVYVADADTVRRETCVSRLKNLNAPVIEVKGDALRAAKVAAPIDLIEESARIPFHNLARRSHVADAP